MTTLTNLRSNSFIKPFDLDRRKAAIPFILLLPPLVVGLLVQQQINLAFLIAGVVLLGIGATILSQPQTTTLLVLFVMYANIPVAAKRSFAVPDLLAASFILLLGIPLLHYIVIRRERILVDRNIYLMLAHLGVLLISAVLSGETALSLDRIVTYVLEGYLLYWLILNTIRTRELLRQSVWALILAGILMGSLSLTQEITKDYDNDFAGMAVVDNGVINTGEVTSFGTEIKRNRLSGPIGEKNRYAQVMVVLLPLALMRIWAERRWWLRLMGAAACIPIVAGVLLSFSRGGGVAVGVTFVAMVLMRMIKWWQVLLVVAIGYVVITTVAPDYLYRLSTAADVADLATGNAQDAGGAVRGRATSGLAAFYIFLDYPAFGIGPGQTSKHTREYGNEIGYRKLEGNRRAHNMYLEELADTGLAGFTLLMSMIGATFFDLIKLRRRWQDSHPVIGYTAAGFILGVTVYMLTAIFLHLSYMRYFWLLMGLAAVAVRLYSEDEVAKAVPEAMAV
ncbi:MAG: O-antigen ligase family protein [Caldilineaceae bacterium]